MTICDWIIQTNKCQDVLCAFGNVGMIITEILACIGIVAIVFFIIDRIPRK